MSAHLLCVRCGESKPRDQFVNDRTRNSGKFPWCKPCVMESRRAAKERPLTPQLVLMGQERACPVCDASLEGLHKGRIYCSESCKNKARNWNVYGFEPHEFRALVKEMGGKCPICRRNVRKWVIDHNHETGETTGVTCTNCNTQLLAYSYHDAEIARRLVDYIENPPVRALFGEKRYTGPERMPNLDRMWGWSQKQKAASGR